jgi:spermidine synthase
MGPSGNQGAPVTAEATFGVVEFRPDPARSQGWTVLMDGVEQSYVDLSDPSRLAYPYVRRLARLVDAAAPGGVPLRVLHLGGGGLTLPRYVAATRPGSPQVVVERDPALVALVTRVLPLPAAASVEILVGDAREAVDRTITERYGTEGYGAAGAVPVPGFDVVLADVFAAASMPDSVAGVGFAAAVARLLAPGGVFGMNVTDVPPLAFSRTLAATLGSVFAEVAVVGGTAMLRGRRAGNVVLTAAAGPGCLPLTRMAAAAARDAEPGRVLHGDTFAVFVGGARPRL